MSKSQTAIIQHGQLESRAAISCGVVAGYMPLLRPGDSVFTAFALNHIMCGAGSFRASSAALTGGSIRHDKRLAETACRTISLSLTGNELCASKFLFENTLFGALSRGLSTNARNAIADSLTNVKSRTTNERFSKGFSVRSRMLWTADHRSCPECIAQDLEERGYAAWRVLHELFQIDRCVYHGCLLQPDLPRSGTVIKQIFYTRLPRASGFMCAGPTPSDAVSRSAGYRRHLSSWCKAFGGGLPELSIDRWLTIVRLAREAVGDFEVLRSQVCQVIESEWGASLETIAVALRLAEGAKFVELELRLATRPRDLSRRIAVLDALIQLGLVTSNAQVQMEMTFGETRAPITEPDRQNPLQKLCTRLLDEGYSPVGVAAVADGLSTVRIRSLDNSLYRPLRLLPKKFLAELLGSRDWPKQSWIRTLLVPRRRSRRTH